jgi:hypothetical protein
LAARASRQRQTILDHPGIVVNEPIGALADLQLGRAYALESRSLRGVDADAPRAKARAAYQDFLALWKNADPDIPIFKQAEAEYARLGYERNGILIVGAGLKEHHFRRFGRLQAMRFFGCGHTRALL